MKPSMTVLHYTGSNYPRLEGFTVGLGDQCVHGSCVLVGMSSCSNMQPGNNEECVNLPIVFLSEKKTKS